MPRERFIKRAMQIAENSEYKFRLGALLLKGNRVLNEGFNDKRFVGFMKKYDEYPSLHAEINVMKGIPQDILCKCSILVVRIDSEGKLKLAKPCQGCRRFAFKKGIKKFYFSDDDGDILEWKNYYKDF